MQLLITRAQAQVEAAVQELRALGVDAVALPLIGIEAVNAGPRSAGAVPNDLAQAWTTLAAHRLVMFVSANAVANFFAAAPPGAAWPAGTLAGCTGPGTTAALRAAQVPASCIREPAAGAATLDSEALWAELQHERWAGASVLIVRGEGGREWLADTLRAAGAAVSFVAAYRRTLPAWSAEQRALMTAVEQRPRSFAWQFTSSEAVRHLVTLSPQRRWSDCPAYATHPRIGQAARDAGLARVRVIAPGTVAQAEAWRADLGGEAGREAGQQPSEAAAEEGAPIQSRPL
jgi:uroporphyrinogen-III synthase